MCIGGKRHTSTHHTHTTKMTDTELILDELQAVYGGVTAIEYGLFSRSPSVLDIGTGNDRLLSYLDTGSGNDRLRIKKV